MSDTTKVVDFRWLPKQRELLCTNHGEDRDVACLFGAFGCGKTQGIVQTAIMSGILYANSRILIGAESNTLLTDTTYRKFYSLLPTEVLAAGDRHRTSWRGCPDEVRIYNGTEFFFRHLSEPERLKSSEFDTIAIEEMSQVPASTFDMLLGRLRWGGARPTIPGLRKTKRKRIFGATNPEESPGWVYKRFFEAPPAPYYRLIRTKTVDNTILTAQDPGYVESLLAALDPELADVYVHGNPGNIRGKRPYRRFSRRLHKSPRKIPLNPELPVILCCDFNVHPCGWVVCQEQDGKTLIFCEITLKKTDTWEMCAAFKEMFPIKAGSPPFRAGLRIYGDSTGNNSTANSKSSNWKIVREELKDYNPSFHVPDNPPVVDRVNAVNARFENALGVVSVIVNPDCTEIIADFEQCSWDKNGTKIDQCLDRQTGAPLRSHWSDAFGYYVHAEFPIGGKFQRRYFHG